MATLVTFGGTRRLAGLCLGTLVGGLAVSGLFAPVANAAPDCSPAGVKAAAAKVNQEAQAYMGSHPEGNKVLMTAAMQPRPQAAATLSAYASANPQEYAEFKAILLPLAEVQSVCGVPVVPPQFQWAFDQFVAS